MKTCLFYLGLAPATIAILFSLFRATVPGFKDIDWRELVIVGLKKASSNDLNQDLFDPEGLRILRENSVNRTKELEHTLWEFLGYQNALDHSPEEEIQAAPLYPKQPPIPCRIFYPNQTERELLEHDRYTLRSEGIRLENLQNKTDDGSYPIILFFHGGGWVLEDSHSPALARMATINNAMVVSVQYRLAPENKYPAALEDCHAVVQYFAHEAAVRYHGNPAYIYLMGDSAGGQLAASVSLWARDSNINIAGVVLIYPMLDYVSTIPDHPEECASFRKANQSVRFLSRDEAQAFWNAYLPEDVRNNEAKQRDPGHSPLQATNFQLLPPLKLISSKRDVLFDHAEKYEQKYKQQGLSVSHYKFENAPHGFFTIRFLFHREISIVERHIQDFLATQTAHAKDKEVNRKVRAEEKRRKEEEERKRREREEEEERKRKEREAEEERKRQEEEERQRREKEEQERKRQEEERQRKEKEEQERKRQEEERKRKEEEEQERKRQEAERERKEREEQERKRQEEEKKRQEQEAEQRKRTEEKKPQP